MYVADGKEREEINGGAAERIYLQGMVHSVQVERLTFGKIV